MSDTPRTNRVTRARSEIASTSVVDSDFARTLERELSASQAEVERLHVSHAVTLRELVIAQTYISSSQAEIEKLVMQLAACCMAALGNTEEAVAQRIKPGHPYYSAAYGDVCAAVDREMVARRALLDNPAEPGA